MSFSPENTSMALFCDFENVALGVRDAKYDKFDIKKVLERLLLKGSIVVKKAYCDWERYKGFKATMHEASFELIEIPHVRQSGKNSADIRLVVDALDLCYTKSHVNTFIIISGDSDFSPLVSKLRENAKQVIGVGVKQSTSDLLIANCDEFIFYDDLVRDSQRQQAKRGPQEAQANAPRRTPEEEHRRKDEAERRRTQALDLVVETFEALAAERGDGGKLRASVVKDALKRRRPDFNESFFGFRSFGSLLEEAQSRGLLELGRDDKSNVYVYRGAGPSRPEPAAEPSRGHAPAQASRQQAAVESPHWSAWRGPAADEVAHTDEPRADAMEPAEADTEVAAPEQAPATSRRTGRKRPARKKADAQASSAADASTAAPAPLSASDAGQADASPAPRKAAARPRRPRKTTTP